MLHVLHWRIFCISIFDALRSILLLGKLENSAGDKEGDEIVCKEIWFALQGRAIAQGVLRSEIAQHFSQLQDGLCYGAGGVDRVSSSSSGDSNCSEWDGNLLIQYVIYLVIVRPYSTIKLNYISIFNYSCLQIILILKLTSYYVLNENNEMGFGIAMSLLFLLPISQSLIIFGIDYYFSLFKSIYFKVKALVQACRNKKAKAAKLKGTSMNKLVY